MTANEARAISKLAEKENIELELKEILEGIERAAKKGNLVITCNSMHSDNRKKLISLGYEVIDVPNYIMGSSTHVVAYIQISW